MSDSYTEFQERVARIYTSQGNGSRKRQKTRAVYVQGRDGYTLIRASAPRRSIPWPGIVLMLFAFFCVKGAIMANMGPDAYAQEVSVMEQTTVLERFRAWTMSPDPVSTWVAQTLKSLG